MDDYQKEQIRQTAYKPIEVAKGIYWVGFADFDAGLSNNPYLVISEKDAMLIDPGPGAPQLYRIIFKKVKEVLEGKIKRIKFLVCSHTDPDVCGSLPLWEKYVHPNAAILATSRTISFLPYFGTGLKMVPIKDGDIVVLGHNRNLKVVQTPYVHAAGSMMLYDIETGTLFSSDLFGAFSVDFSLFADADYIGRAINFATVHFGSREALKNTISKLRELDIRTICPQHGSIIKQHINTYLDVFQHLEPAELLKISKKEPTRDDLREMLKRAEDNLRSYYGESVDMKSVLEKVGFYKAISNKYISEEEIKDIGWKIFRYYGDVAYLHYIMGISKYACEKKIRNPIFSLPDEITWEKVKYLPKHTPKILSSIMNRYVEKELSSYLASEEYEEYVKEKITTTTGGTTGFEPATILDLALSGIHGKKYTPELDDIINSYMMSIINTIKEFGGTYYHSAGKMVVTFPADKGSIKSAIVCALSLLYRIGRIKYRKGTDIDIAIGLAVGKAMKDRYSKDVIGEGVDMAKRLRKAANGGSALLLETGLGEVLQEILSNRQYYKYFKFKKGKLVVKSSNETLNVIKVERL